MKMFVTMILLIPLFQSLVFADGEDITVIDTSGMQTKGELLALRPDEIVLFSQSGASEQQLLEHPEYLVRIPRANIAGVEIEGHSHVLLGIGVGGATGLIAGMVIGASSTPEPRNLGDAVVYPIEGGANTAAGGLIGLLAGGLVGGIIGGAASSSDQHINPSKNYGELHALVRYQGEEPEYLKKIR